jgi:hypothetical protein
MAHGPQGFQHPNKVSEQGVQQRRVPPSKPPMPQQMPANGTSQVDIPASFLRNLSTTLLSGPGNTAANMSSVERLSLIDHGHRWAFIQGVSQAAKNIASGLGCEVVGKGTLFGRPVQMPRGMSAQQLEDHILQGMKSLSRYDLDSAPANTSKLIMSVLGKQFPGLYGAASRQKKASQAPPQHHSQRPQDQPVPMQRMQPTYTGGPVMPMAAQMQSLARTSPYPGQGYNRQVPLQALAQPPTAAKGTTATKSNGNTRGSKGKAATPAKPRRGKKEPAGWTLTGESQEINYDGIRAMSYACTDGHKRCLNQKQVEAIRKRTANTGNFVQAQQLQQPQQAQQAQQTQSLIIPAHANASQVEQAAVPVVATGKRKHQPAGEQKSTPAKRGKKSQTPTTTTSQEPPTPLFQSALALPTGNPQPGVPATVTPTQTFHSSLALPTGNVQNGTAAAAAPVTPTKTFQSSLALPTRSVQNGATGSGNTPINANTTSQSPCSAALYYALGSSSAMSPAEDKVS